MYHSLFQIFVYALRNRFSVASDSFPLHKLHEWGKAVSCWNIRVVWLLLHPFLFPVGCPYSSAGRFLPAVFHWYLSSSCWSIFQLLGSWHGFLYLNFLGNILNFKRSQLWISSVTSFWHWRIGKRTCANRRERTYIRMCVIFASHAQSFCGALPREEMDFGYPSGYEFLLLWKWCYRRRLQNKEVEPLACTAGDKILDLWNIQRLVSWSSCPRRTERLGVSRAS